MQEEIVFYYVIYTNSPFKGFHKFWGCFLTSIIVLRHFYPNNRIVVITYENDDAPALVYESSKQLNFEIVSQKPIYEKCNQPNMNWKMFSRHINCYLHAKQNKDKGIYLDADVFLLNKFSNFNWDKVGILNADGLGVNGGIIYFDSTKDATEKYAQFIDDEYNDIMNGKYDKISYIKSVYPHCDQRCSIQEETMLRNLRKRDKARFMDIFYNIAVRNNCATGLPKLQQDGLNKRFNNIHLMSASPEAIPSAVYNSKYFKDILKNNYFMRKIMPGLQEHYANLPIKMI